MPEVQFAVNSYRARSPNLSAQRLVNWYAETAPQDAISPVIIEGTPGTKAFSTIGTGPTRGAVVMDDVLYVVVGDTLYSINSAGTASSLGTINTFYGRVSMTHNNAPTKQMCIVDGTDGWIYDTSGGLQQITDTDFPTADVVDVLDDYFLVNKNGTNRFQASNVSSGLVWTATDFGDTTGSPDNLITLIVNQRRILLFGRSTTEEWFNSGASGFPFERNQSVFIERGIGDAPHAVAKADNTVWWLGDDLIVYFLNGTLPAPISTFAVASAMESYRGKTADAFAYSYTQAQHKFVVFTFPSVPATWVFDISTGLWHERESRDLGKWRANFAITAYDKLLVGDSETGRMGELDLKTYDEYGELILASAAGPPMAAGGKLVGQSLFEVEMETGVGLTTGQGSDPEVWLDWSDDGGHTWSLRKPARAFGKIGEYRKRVRWHRLGSFYNRTMRLSTSDPVRRALVAAVVEAA